MELEIKIGLWSEIDCCMTKPLKLKLDCRKNWFDSTLSSLLSIRLCPSEELVQVNFGPETGKSSRLQASMQSLKWCMDAKFCFTPPYCSWSHLIVLKSPITTQGLLLLAQWRRESQSCILPCTEVSPCWCTEKAKLPSNPKNKTIWAQVRPKSTFGWDSVKP